MKLLSVALITLLAGYAALIAYVYLRQDSLIYYPDFPSRKVYPKPGSVGLDYETISLQTEDNVKIQGWFVSHPEQIGVVLFCHGNAGNISHRLDTLRLIHDLGLSVLIFDYRGYGESKGKPSEQGTYRDAEAAWQFLTQEKQYKANDIIIWGRSLGAAVAAKIAEGKPIKGVILESPFTSAPDLGKELYPFLPVKIISRFSYDVKKSMGLLVSPLLIVHSRDDEIIPFKHGQRLFELARQPKYFLEIRGGHNNGLYVSREQYIAALGNFLNTLK